MMKTQNLLSVRVATIVSALLVGAPVLADVPSALVREADPLGAGIVDSISNTAVNRVGGYAVTLNIDDAGTTISTIFGNAAGGPGSILRSEGTFGDFQQNSFESFFGFSDAGVASYSPSVTRLSSGTTGLDAIWLGDTPILTEEDPVAAAPGEFSSFNSRPGVTAGGTPYWVGGLTNVAGGSTQDRALFFDSNILIRGGDNVGVPEPVTVGNGIDFDYRFSAQGTNYIAPIDVQAAPSEDLLITINGTVISPGGSPMREGTLMPVSVGGDGVENWDNFDFVGINESGGYFVTGDTDGADVTDEFVFMNDAVILREGDMLGSATLAGSIEGGFMNENGDWAVTWDVDVGPANLEALIINGELILTEGEPVDWNGDGVIDGSDGGAIVDNFTGISALTLSDRQADGTISAYFTADVDINGTILEGAFRITVPEPCSAALLVFAIVGMALARRRRS